MALLQYSFTTLGVQQWQRDLYDLPDYEVDEEALAAATTFTAWLIVRFDLSADQVDFMNGIDPDLLQHWGGNVSFFIAHRLAIELIKPEVPSAPEQRSYKRITSKETTQSEPPKLKATDDGTRLTFTIQY